MDQREDNVPEMPAYPRNPKLRLIRSGHSGAGDGLTSAAAMADRARRRSRTNRCLGALLNVVALGVLAAALFVGYKVWSSLREKDAGLSASANAYREVKE